MRLAITATEERVEVESSILVRWLLLALLPISVIVYGATRMLRAHDLVLMESDGVTCTLAPDNPEIRRSVAVGSVRKVNFRTTSGGVVIFLDTNAGEMQVPEAIPRSQQPEVEKWLLDGLVGEPPRPPFRVTLPQSPFDAGLVPLIVGIAFFVALFSGTGLTIRSVTDAGTRTIVVDHRGVVRRKTRTIAFDEIKGIRRLPVAKGYQSVALVLGPKELEEITHGLTDAQAQEVETRLRRTIGRDLER